MHGWERGVLTKAVKGPISSQVHWADGATCGDEDDCCCWRVQSQRRCGHVMVSIVAAGALAAAYDEIGASTQLANQRAVA